MQRVDGSRTQLLQTWHSVLWPIITKLLGLALALNEAVLRDELRPAAFAVGLALCAGGDASESVKRLIVPSTVREE